MGVSNNSLVEVLEIKLRLPLSTSRSSSVIVRSFCPIFVTMYAYFTSTKQSLSPSAFVNEENLNAPNELNNVSTAPVHDESMVTIWASVVSSFFTINIS